MRKCVLFVFLLLRTHTSFAVTHSLQYLYTATSGIPNFPEFVTVGLVDGEPIVYYDSKIRRMVPRQEWMTKAVDADYWEQQTQIITGFEPMFKNNIEVAKQRFNQTGGIHTVQRMYGCEWDDETGATGGYDQHAYDGSDFIALDFKDWSYVAPVPQAFITAVKWGHDMTRIDYLKRYYTQECIEWLKKYVTYGRNSLERTVRPEVSLLQKDPSSPVTCHATGFYPKGIVVTWKKDGEDVYSDVEVGETVPNGDGTFQTKAKLSVKPEDWKKNSYSCVVQHKSSQKDIVVELREEKIKTNPGGLPLAIIIGCVAGLLVLVTVGVGIVLWKRRGTGYGKTSTSDSDSYGSSQQIQKA